MQFGRYPLQTFADQGAVVSWWRHAPAGIEQGWTVPSPRGAGPLRLDVRVDGARTASQLERYRKRLQTADKALEQTADDEARTRAQRQVDFYGERVKALEASLAEHQEFVRRFNAQEGWR